MNQFQVGDAIPQAGGRLLRSAEDAAELHQPGLAMFGRLAVFAMVVDAGLEFINPAAEFLEVANHRLDSLGTQPQFLDQLDGPAPPQSEPAPRLAWRARPWARTAGGDLVVAPVALQKHGSAF